MDTYRSLDAPHRPARTALAAALLTLLLTLTACVTPGMRLPSHEALLTPLEHLNLGVTYERDGDYDAAIAQYQAAATGKLPQAYLFLGNAYTARHDYPHAETAYRQALAMAPADPAVLNNLAWLLYLRRTHLTEAASLTRQAITIDPDHAATYRDTLTSIQAAQTTP